MGHREDLLAGAKRCLYEKGYARTTARDIVAASGTNLASIGYHYGSKDALMNAALFSAIEDWGDQLAQALATDAGPHATPLERFELYWTRVLDSHPTQKQIWAATFEMFGQVDRVPDVRRLIAEGLEEGRNAWAMLLQGIDPSADPEKAYQVGSFYQALLSGVLVQWLVDPDRAPSGHDLAEALRAIIAANTQAEHANRRAEHADPS
jgi:AcrR family transcriptional regulator